MYGRLDKICLTKTCFFPRFCVPIKKGVFLMLRSGSIFKGSTYLSENGGQFNYVEVCVDFVYQKSIDMSSVDSASTASILAGLPPLGLVSL